jgi:hypothetical protein
VQRVTDTFSLKESLDVAQGSGGYLAAWAGTPESTSVIEYVRIGPAGTLNGAIGTVPRERGITPQVAFSPVRNGSCRRRAA